MIAVTDIYGRKAATGLNWITFIAMTAFHIGAVAAFFYIDAGAILAAVVLWWISGSLGIGMAYHRLLTHRGYKTPKWMSLLTACSVKKPMVLQSQSTKKLFHAINGSAPNSWKATRF
jgi:stearoyl-CoA desaturase (delta-9 desaturase)